LQALKKQGKDIEQEKEALEKNRADVFTPHEIAILTKSASNFDFHYMGSAKIMARIGKGFAEALVEMIKGQNHEGTRIDANHG